MSLPIVSSRKGGRRGIANATRVLNGNQRETGRDSNGVQIVIARGKGFLYLDFCNEEDNRGERDLGTNTRRIEGGYTRDDARV